jgi:hypothetical protein
MPLDSPWPPLELEARSIGTRRTMLAGRARARKIGTIRYAGVVLKERKWRNNKRTSREMRKRVTAVVETDSVAEAISEGMLGKVG